MVIFVVLNYWYLLQDLMKGLEAEKNQYVLKNHHPVYALNNEFFTTTTTTLAMKRTLKQYKNKLSW